MHPHRFKYLIFHLFNHIANCFTFRCSDGYFGNPQIVGGYCQKCDCSGNADTSVPGWCDSLTGQCLKCLYNTAGWNCGECKPEHYGNAELRNCQRKFL